MRLPSKQLVDIEGKLWNLGRRLRDKEGDPVNLSFQVAWMLVDEFSLQGRMLSLSSELGNLQQDAQVKTELRFE
ncbi:hypothetical protein EVAR_5179_1 [Eumeta japonica]|uniref:Uncharacterized protein n=1 Tax=Eumeta variegata TaxID=151549 RepID=A0A4C1V4C1_EUMVA|nr:hypothetical protein EVAR_5179_1 [Eumeta japonica]